MKILKIGTYNYRLGSRPHGTQIFPVHFATDERVKIMIHFLFEVHVKYLKRYEIRDLGHFELLVNGQLRHVMGFQTLDLLNTFVNGNEGVKHEKKFGVFDLFNRKLKFTIPFDISSIPSGKHIELNMWNDLSENLLKYNFMECKIYKTIKQ